MAFDQDLTRLIFPFRWSCFPIKIGRNAQWEHLFSMDFNYFPTIYLIGVYPQRDVSLAMKDIDASKVFFDLWEHLSFAIFAIFDLKRQLKLLGMACNQVQTCLTLAMGRFSY